MDNLILEIIRYTLPALVVFGTVYFLMNKFYTHQAHQLYLQQNNPNKEKSYALKMQAYERLIMLCERIDPINLYLRLHNGDMNAKQMQETMLIAIQQEFEHNYTQQLFVSQNLWKIISLAKDQISNIISEVGDKVSPNDDSSKLIETIERVKNELNINPLLHAKSAIKNEIDAIL
jgi:exo-beta-1,3-glucanase (GH17 family)